MADFGNNRTGMNQRDIIVTMRLNSSLCQNVQDGRVYDVSDPALKGMLINREKGNYIKAQLSNVVKSGASVRPLPPEKCDPNPTLTNMPAKDSNGCYLTKEKKDSNGHIKTIMCVNHSDSYSSSQINNIFETGKKVNITRAKGVNGGLYATTVVNADIKTCGVEKPNSMYIDTKTLRASSIPVVTSLNEAQYIATVDARKQLQKRRNLVNDIMEQYSGNEQSQQAENEF